MIMRIAIVTAVFLPYRGGMANAVRTQAELLCGLGHEVTVFAPGRAGGDPEAPYRVERLKPLFAIGKGAFVPQIVGRLRGFDRVILHYPAFGLAEPALFWKLFPGRRTRFSVVYHMDPIAPGLRGLVFSALRALTLRPLLASADRVAVTSLDYASAGPLAAMPKKVKAKLYELPLSVDVARLSARTCSEADKTRFGLGGKDLLFVGGLDRAHWFKGVDVLLGAFADAAVPGLKLHLVGSGDLEGRYRAKAAKLGVADRVVFHGALGDDDLPALLACADALALPSVGRSEAFGLVLVEAMAAGKPVVATRLPGVRTVVRDGETGILAEPGDRGSLARAIRTLLSDPSLMRRMGERARQEARSRFDHSAVKAALAGLLED